MSQEPRQNLQLPRHVAIIMDGNGRWATERGLPRAEGHRAGVEKIRSVLDFMGEHAVEYVTIYAFSTENWNRPQDEVSGIMAILREVIEEEAQALHERGVRIIHLGRTDRLGADLKEAVSNAQELTKDNTRMTLSVAFDYGGRSEILEAIRGLMRDSISPEDLDEDLLSQYLYTAGIPDPDLIIRTGGEHRLSNFLLWQSAYSEYYHTPTLWPDLDAAELAQALESFGNRRRRYGGLNPEDQSPAAAAPDDHSLDSQALRD